MSLGLSLGLSCCVSQTLQLRISGGMTTSIFPEIEVWLERDKNMKALKGCLHRRSDIKEYRSVIDFLVCLFYPNIVDECWAYYNGFGQQLRFTITTEERDRMCENMLEQLEEAWEAYKANDYKDFWFTPEIYEACSNDVFYNHVA